MADRVAPRKFSGWSGGCTRFAKCPQNVDAELTEEIAAIHDSFVGHHRIEEERMRGAVARLGFDHLEFFRQEAGTAGPAEQRPSSVSAVHGCPRIVGARIERAQFVRQPQMN